MGSAGRYIKNKGSKKNAKTVFYALGIIFIIMGSLMFYGNIRMKQTCDEMPAVITRIGSCKRKNRVYVEYTYRDKVYNSALNYYNAFTMKEGKPITVYIASASPEFPKVPTNAAIFLLEGMGFAAILFATLGDEKN